MIEYRNLRYLCDYFLKYCWEFNLINYTLFVLMSSGLVFIVLTKILFGYNMGSYYQHWFWEKIEYYLYFHNLVTKGILLIKWSFIHQGYSLDYFSFQRVLQVPNSCCIANYFIKSHKKYEIVLYFLNFNSYC